MSEMELIFLILLCQGLFSLLIYFRINRFEEYLTTRYEFLNKIFKGYFDEGNDVN